MTSALQPFNPSTDYAELIRLLDAGHQIVCELDYNSTIRDFAKARCIPSIKGKPYYVVGVRGFSYFESYEIEEIIQECRRANLTFLAPPSASNSAEPTHAA